MKIGQALLQDRCGLIQPKYAKHIDLSHCNLVTLEGVKPCMNIQTLILRYNSISIIPTFLTTLPELWKLDLSHNVVSSLEGFLKLRCIGTLVLSYNNISWPELRKIQHLIILDLRLVGNPLLEKDPYYRRHVIDCLPNTWMLDGVLVTAAERQQISRFFRNSEVLDRPVRHKLKPTSAKTFVPTHLKHLNRQAVLGKNGLQLLSKFSQNEKHTLRTDFRRIRFIAETFENDLAVQRSYWSLMARSGVLPPDCSSPLPAYMHTALTNNSSNFQVEVSSPVSDRFHPEEEIAPHGFGKVPPVVKLVSCRENEVERFNMLLLVLVAGLEFSLPMSLMEETLHTANLANINGVDCGALLQLPHEDLLLTCSVLLSSVIIDRGEGQEGGLYKRLFVSLFVTLSNLLRTTHGYPDQYHLKFMSPAVHRSLLAAEVVQLMCLVPTFLDMMDRDQGVLDVVAIATQNPHIKDVIQDMMWNATDYDFDEVSSGLLQLVRSCIEGSNYEMLELEPGLVPYNNPLSAVALQSHKKIRQRARSAVAARRARSQGVSRVPGVGDTVTLSRQRKGRIVGLHQDQLALVQISAHPVTPIRDVCGEYVYIDMQFMAWDHVTSLWKQQNHVQEYPSDARMSGKTEKCYSVISNNDYNRYQPGYLQSSQSKATSEIGEAYYVHDDKQLHFEVDDEGAQYITQRPITPERAASGGVASGGATPGRLTPGGAPSTQTEGVFAPEDEVHVRITPQREAIPQRENFPVREAIPVMKRVLEHATEQQISKQEQELRDEVGPGGHVSSVDVVHQLYRPPLQEEVTDDPDLTIPRTEIKIIPSSQTIPTTPRTGFQNRRQSPTRARSHVFGETKVISCPLSLKSNVSKSHDSIQFEPPERAISPKFRDADRLTRSMRRPHTRSSLPKSTASFDNDSKSLITKQKSLPDVSGISVFAYSMGRPGVIRPPTSPIT